MNETFYKMLKNTDNLKIVRECCLELMDYYKPLSQYQQEQLVRQAVLNFTNQEDFDTFLIDLVVRMRRYHVEFLAWRINSRVLPLILNAVDTWEAKR